MKNMKHAVFALILLGALPVTSCKASLDSDTAKVSYGLGMQFANDMKNRGFEIDIKAFVQAVEDVYKGQKSRIADEEIRAAFQKVSEGMMQKQIAKAAENLKTGEEYLTKNKAKDGVKVTASGLQYKVVKEGAGASPRPTDMVKVHYRGTLIDGTEFDSSYKRNQPAEFRLNQVIPGWTEGLQLMKVGSKYELTIPAKLGYGEQGNQRIPGNSVLNFEVELLEIKK
ncbi:MAG TPA: FKBP-type peptidyl-prolyl cis-trans isomerase [Spirochaetota bacterium]|nr:FKBP-type peptidyl-prolyl cis-trans isomerase [Spirochaetota bacterium]HNT09906.1 FKBP-type peptidyl-prolyl cis-trans isomerase [Spirochaetota bacterium]HPU88058.1 FKBP-type peptidyl-prolyl cis-trans isomerase [Spirochaetota bacterium]